MLEKIFTRNGNDFQRHTFLFLQMSVFLFMLLRVKPYKSLLRQMIRLRKNTSKRILNKESLNPGRLPDMIKVRQCLFFNIWYRLFCIVNNTIKIYIRYEGELDVGGTTRTRAER